MKINDFLTGDNEIIVIDNFLNEEDIEKIQNEVLNSNFSWHSQDTTHPPQYEYVKLNDDHSYEAPFFTHWLLHPDGTQSDWFEICKFIVNIGVHKLRNEHAFEGGVNILRCKTNLYPTIKDSEKKSYHTPHKDDNKKHSVFLYFANDSDGDTIIFNEKSAPWTVKKTIEPKAGRLVVFNGDLYHASNSPVNHKNRITVNVNVSGL